MTHGQKEQSAIRDIRRSNNNSHDNLAPEMLDDRDLISSAIFMLPLIVIHLLCIFITWGILEDCLGIDYKNTTAYKAECEQLSYYLDKKPDCLFVANGFQEVAQCIGVDGLCCEFSYLLTNKGILEFAHPKCLFVLTNKNIYANYTDFQKRLLT